jgi:uncharacterized membrane protein SirB2
VRTARLDELIAYYLQVKWVHVVAVLCSGGLFALRGLLLQLGGGSWAMAWPLRLSCYAVDTVLLTAALMLVSMLPHAMFANGWLAAKLLLLPAYVGLGLLAFGRARGPRARLCLWLAALAVYATMLGIARMHHPLGWWQLVAG